MRTASIPGSTAGGDRRSLASSQDVCRYQATNMPPPTYDLDHKAPSALRRAILVPALIIAAIGGAILLVQRIGIWLAP